ncbi:uncharacterized protein (TIGR00255 family) [Balneicella halophila]|uniref:Uncharacterized protein (TIGR00255 family) n=1 Tax=Balneicella halophila TaxID=1537566 RepID=A0A7L4UTE2_BALHA|nr:YicC/YloC family endoribonuclease [Balneicella halophila]PVX52637.1 uncharacterized protein (TIGR00255 family) [Balneicella halophila]
MILSMTGFGKAEDNFSNKNVSLEIRALNSKQIDIYTRIPSDYKDKDLEIRNFLKDELIRGKIDFTLTISTQEGVGNTTINRDLAKEYFNELKGLSKDLGVDLSTENIIATLLKMPEVLTAKQKDITETEWNLLWHVIGEAVRRLHKFRQQEGQSLQEDLLENVTTIERLLDEVEQYEPERIETVKLRLQEQLKGLNIEVDKERFEQELIYYLEKLDINEEKVRLRNHCHYFRETVNSNEQSVGKKLGFIAQEMGREINTLGSKANHMNIQQLVVQMKEALEKIKEQTLNVL